MAAVAGALDAQLAANAAAEPDLAARIREAGIEFVYYQFVTLSGRVMAKVVPAATWPATSRRACSSTARRSPTSCPIATAS